MNSPRFKYQGRRSTISDRYHRDPYTWVRLQVEALRKRDQDAVDCTNVIEELLVAAGRQSARIQGVSG